LFGDFAEEIYIHNGAKRIPLLKVEPFSEFLKTFPTPIPLKGSNPRGTWFNPIIE